MGTTEDARSLRKAVQEDASSRAGDAHADGHCGSSAAIDYRSNHGLPEGIARSTFDPFRNCAVDSQPAFFVLCTAQPPRAGPLLPHPRRGNAHEGILLLLDAVDPDRAVARN